MRNFARFSLTAAIYLLFIYTLWAPTTLAQEELDEDDAYYQEGIYV